MGWEGGGGGDSKEWRFYSYLKTGGIYTSTRPRPCNKRMVVWNEKKAVVGDGGFTLGYWRVSWPGKPGVQPGSHFWTEEGSLGRGGRRAGAALHHPGPAPPPTDGTAGKNGSRALGKKKEQEGRGHFAKGHPRTTLGHKSMTAIILLEAKSGRARGWERISTQRAGGILTKFTSQPGTLTARHLDEMSGPLRGPASIDTLTAL